MGNFKVINILIATRTGSTEGHLLGQIYNKHKV